MPRLNIQVLVNTDKPIYMQIVDRIRDLVVKRKLAPGDKLPSHRDLALELAIAPLTVKRAYDELEKQGVVKSRRGLGTFVAESPSKTAPGPALRELAEKLVVEAKLSRLTLDETKQILCSSWKKKTGGR